MLRVAVLMIKAIRDLGELQTRGRLPAESL